jgi:6-phosphogluconolactonase
VHHELRSFANADEMSRAAADFVAETAKRCIGEHGTFSFAVSGGRTPLVMLHALAERDVSWSDVVIYQVDERIAAPASPERNLTGLVDALTNVQPTIVAMPVEDADLDDAAARYEASLPARVDLVHLGLGPDGHTASLVPNDPVLDVTDRLVALTGDYQGFRRMTMTYPALARADQILWVVSGADKRAALSLLVRGDLSIPAGRVEAARSLIMADSAATPQ